MVEVKLARRFLWVEELACSNRAYHKWYHGRVVKYDKLLIYFVKGSNPFGTYILL